MAFEIKWTPLAKENYHDIVSFLFDEWGEKTAEKFTDELQATLSLLERFPFMGRQHPKLMSIRQLVVGSHQILFYTVLENMIVVLNVVDTKTL